MKRNRLTLIRRSAAILALAAAQCAAGSAPASGFANFVTRRSDKLMDGIREFRFMGVNMPGQIVPYDFTLAMAERMVLPNAWEIENSFKTLQAMNAKCVRWVMLPVRHPESRNDPRWDYVLAPGRFNEEAFRTIDQALAFANKYGVRVIFSVTGAGDMAAPLFAGAGAYAAHRGRTELDFYTDPQLREDFKATLRYLAARTNSITGIRYSEDKAILCWQLGNELRLRLKADGQGDAEILKWESDMAAYIKSLDGNHLVMDGRALAPLPAEPDPNIDIYTQHYYGDPGLWAERCRANVASMKNKRPFIVGEFGPYINNPASAPSVMTGFHRLLEELPASGASGALLWSMYSHHRDGGYLWHQIITYPSVWAYHWPGHASAQAHREREVLHSLREAAFKIEGRQVEPVAVPETPRLLPFRETPLLSWLGSVGASGYDIERATTDAGPWMTIASNVSDADVAYRPLFNDTSAETGVDYYYRVAARNESGRSAASAAAGPVRFKRLSLVDEFQDWSRAAERSPGLVLGNEYNGLYAEYLFRARGAAGDRVAYRLPGDLKSFHAEAWFATAQEDLSFEVSADGSAFRKMTAKRRVRVFGRPPVGVVKDQSRTLVEYDCALEGHDRYLRIVWRGAAELDRIQLDYAGQRQ